MKRTMLIAVAGVVVLLLTLLASAPTLVSWGLFRGTIISAVSGAVNGTVTIDELSVGWFSGVRVRGFMIELFGTGLLAAIIAVACKFGARLQDRLALGIVVPAFAMLSSHAVVWNFFHLPDAFSMVLFIDGMIAWTLSGLACAIIIKPAKR